MVCLLDWCHRGHNGAGGPLGEDAWREESLMLMKGSKIARVLARSPQLPTSHLTPRFSFSSMSNKLLAGNINVS